MQPGLKDSGFSYQIREREREKERAAVGFSDELCMSGLSNYPQIVRLIPFCTCD